MRDNFCIYFAQSPRNIVKFLLPRKSYAIKKGAYFHKKTEAWPSDFICWMPKLSFEHHKVLPYARESLLYEGGRYLESCHEFLFTWACIFSPRQKSCTPAFDFGKLIHYFLYLHRVFVANMLIKIANFMYLY